MTPKAEESTDHVHKKARVTRYEFRREPSKLGMPLSLLRIQSHWAQLFRSKSVRRGRSPDIGAALEGEFKEAKDQVLRLPEDDPDMFSHFGLWLYTGEILESHESAKDVSRKVLTDIYLFGEVRGK